MEPGHKHTEKHRSDRIGWLRAAVLGANDGIVSTASLIVGVASAHTSTHDITITAVAGLVAGAMSMAAGEYVSVSSQADTEEADLAQERYELKYDWKHEHKELAEIYEKRGLDPVLAKAVATQLMAFDALGAHSRDELGILEATFAKPVQAALASAATFALGAASPLIVVLVAPRNELIPAVSVGSLFLLSALGALAARVGGAKVWKGALRVLFWGALALAASALVGSLFGTV